MEALETSLAEKEIMNKMIKEPLSQFYFPLPGWSTFYATAQLERLVDFAIPDTYYVLHPSFSAQNIINEVFYSKNDLTILVHKCKVLNLREQWTLVLKDITLNTQILSEEFMLEDSLSALKHHNFLAELCNG